MLPVRQTRPRVELAPRRTLLLLLDPRSSDLALVSYGALVATTATVAVAAPAVLLLAAIWVGVALGGLVTIAAAQRWPHRVPQVALAVGLLAVAGGLGWVLFVVWRYLVLGAAVLAVAVAAVASRANRGGGCRCR